jgi:hypothetical protein
LSTANAFKSASLVEVIQEKSRKIKKNQEKSRKIRMNGGLVLLSSKLGTP